MSCVSGHAFKNEVREAGMKAPDGGVNELRPGVVEVGRKVVLDSRGVDVGARKLSKDGGRSDTEGCGGNLGSTRVGTRKASAGNVTPVTGAGRCRSRPRSQGEGGANSDRREANGVQPRGPKPRHTDADISFPDAGVLSMSAVRQRAESKTLRSLSKARMAKEAACMVR